MGKKGKRKNKFNFWFGGGGRQLSQGGRRFPYISLLMKIKNVQQSGGVGMKRKERQTFHFLSHVKV